MDPTKNVRITIDLLRLPENDYLLRQILSKIEDVEVYVKAHAVDMITTCRELEVEDDPQS